MARTVLAKTLHRNVSNVSSPSADLLSTALPGGSIGPEMATDVLVPGCDLPGPCWRRRYIGMCPMSLAPRLISCRRPCLVAASDLKWQQTCWYPAANCPDRAGEDVTSECVQCL